MTFGADTLKEDVMKKYFFICLTALAVMNVSCVKENPSPTDEVTNTEKTLSLKAAAPAWRWSDELSAERSRSGQCGPRAADLPAAG